MNDETLWEQNMIGATIRGQGSTRTILELDGSDFTDTRHRVIAAVLKDMIRKGTPIDLMTVQGELASRGKLSTPGGAGGTPYVAHLSGVGEPVSAEYYATKIREATRVREFQRATSTTGQSLATEEATDHLDELLRIHRQALENIPAPLVNDDTDDAKDSLATILAEQDEATDWLIPGLVAREERVVFVAGEGVAKTTLLRQQAVCMAAGLNPWNQQRVSDGLRVLFVDAENSRAQSRRAYRWIAGRCHRPLMAPGWRDRIIHKTRNDGVNLIGRDEQWFLETCERVSPDVIILSPAYKLMRGDPKEDRDVLALLDVFDRVRVKHKAALLIETHAPHGTFNARDMRPFGSSVWLRWPEIGFGLQRDSNIPEGATTRRPEYLESIDWRGAREERDWPQQIRYGARNEAPWVPTDPDWRPSVDLGYSIREAAA